MRFSQSRVLRPIFHHFRCEVITPGAYLKIILTLSVTLSVLSASSLALSIALSVALSVALSDSVSDPLFVNHPCNPTPVTMCVTGTR